MARRKQARIAEYNILPNCLNNDTSRKGKWREFFGNDHPIVLELGCGKADLSMGLARRNPGINYVGIDLKSPRMWVAASSALQEGVKNIAFLRADLVALSQFFAPGEVDGIWITFPDPFPRKKAAKRRLTHQRYLDQYCQVMKQGSPIWFKTDSADLFEWTLEHHQELNATGNWHIEHSHVTRDLHHSPERNDDNGILTDYERRWIGDGLTIKYVVISILRHPEPRVIHPTPPHTSPANS